MKRSTKSAPVSWSTSYLIGSAFVGISMITLNSCGAFGPGVTLCRLMCGAGSGGCPDCRPAGRALRLPEWAPGGATAASLKIRRFPRPCALSRGPAQSNDIDRGRNPTDDPHDGALHRLGLRTRRSRLRLRAAKLD